MGRIESKISSPLIGAGTGTVQGTGTAGQIPVWTDPSTLGDSSFTESDIEDLLGSVFNTLTIANNQAVAANVTSALLDSGSERGALFEYDVYRKTDTASSEVRANGSLRLIYRVETSTWEVCGQFEGGDSHGVTFSVTAGGQIQYTSTNISGSNYVGQLVWRLIRFPASTALTINNNQGVAGNLGLSFSIASHRGAVIEYDISRKTDTASSEVRASGILRVAYRTETTAWEILGQEEHGDSHGVTFSITSAGVVQYTSTNIAGSNYAGSLQYNVRRYNV